jgi:hypothetical protein
MLSPMTPLLEKNLRPPRAGCGNTFSKVPLNGLPPGAFPWTKDEILHIIDMSISVLDPVDGTCEIHVQSTVCRGPCPARGWEKLSIIGCPNLNLETGRVVDR